MNLKLLAAKRRKLNIFLIILLLLPSVAIGYDYWGYLTRGEALTIFVPYTGATSNVDLGDNNLTAYNVTAIEADFVNLDVSGNTTLAGLETNCMHCADNDTYFHGDGFFQGNITAPNIEIMESLIVHGNSSCTGTATACGDIGDSTLCGWTVNTGQRGCRWRWWLGGAADCFGTATACEDMSTATCELQHVCTLTVGAVGFIINSLGLSGNFSINTTGDITAANLYVDNITAVNNITAGGVICDSNGCIGDTAAASTLNISIVPVQPNKVYLNVW